MWQTTNSNLYRKFIFADFIEAFAFITKVAIASEKNNHHPTLKNTYNVVEIWLSTHDAGNIVTEKDEQLAKAIDSFI
jgi:4a-hydroxytetrahydrobiopterin dehydratase